MSNLNQIAELFEAYTSAYNGGQMSKEEYASLLAGLEVEKAATLNAEELQYKEQLNTAINAAISAVSMLG